jgi:hypothetical protein
MLSGMKSLAQRRGTTTNASDPIACKVGHALHGARVTSSPGGVLGQENQGGSLPRHDPLDDKSRCGNAVNYAAFN